MHHIYRELWHYEHFCYLERCYPEFVDHLNATCGEMSSLVTLVSSKAALSVEIDRPMLNSEHSSSLNLALIEPAQPTPMC